MYAPGGEYRSLTQRCHNSRKETMLQLVSIFNDGGLLVRESSILPDPHIMSGTFRNGVEQEFADLLPLPPYGKPWGVAQVYRSCKVVRQDAVFGKLPDYEIAQINASMNTRQIVFFIKNYHVQLLEVERSMYAYFYSRSGVKIIRIRKGPGGGMSIQLCDQKQIQSMEEGDIFVRMVDYTHTPTTDV